MVNTFEQGLIHTPRPSFIQCLNENLILKSVLNLAHVGTADSQNIFISPTGLLSTFLEYLLSLNNLATLLE